jgi:hypothetical protein
VLQRRLDRDDVRVGLGPCEAQKPVAGAAAVAMAVVGPALVEHDPDGQRKRVMAGAFEIVRQLLDARLVRDCRKRIGLVAGQLGRIAATPPVHMVERSAAAQ